MARDRGIEPRAIGLEPIMLPLHQSRTVVDLVYHRSTVVVNLDPELVSRSVVEVSDCPTELHASRSAKNFLLCVYDCLLRRAVHSR